MLLINFRMLYVATADCCRRTIELFVFKNKDVHGYFAYISACCFRLLLINEHPQFKCLTEHSSTVLNKAVLHRRLYPRHPFRKMKTRKLSCHNFQEQ